MNQQFRPSKKNVATPVRGSQGGARRVSGFSPWQVFVLFLVCTLLISIPIWTHPLPPVSDYINHLARMHVIATIHKNPLLANFYEIDWKIIPNLTMDLVVPVLARWVNIYLAGQIFMVGMFAVIISGTLALNRVLIGRWSRSRCSTTTSSSSG